MYVSPEMLETNDSGYFTDFWALGVIIFEMTMGYSPFTAANESQVFDNILNRRFAFPTGADPQMTSLVNDLLNPNPFERKSRCEYNKLKSHPFFCHVDWALLES